MMGDHHLQLSTHTCGRPTGRREGPPRCWHLMRHVSVAGKWADVELCPTVRAHQSDNFWPDGAALLVFLGPPSQFRVQFCAACACGGIGLGLAMRYDCSEPLCALLVSDTTTVGSERRGAGRVGTGEGRGLCRAGLPARQSLDDRRLSHGGTTAWDGETTVVSATKICSD